MSEFSLYDKWLCAKQEAWLRRRQIERSSELSQFNDEERMNRKKMRLACMEAIADDYFAKLKTNGHCVTQEQYLIDVRKW